MVEIGDEAPDFTVPVANDEIERFTLSESLDAAPVVLAFFPAAFSPTCSTELATFQRRLDEFERAGATVYGLSTDTPFALAAFRDRHGVEFGLLSDHDREVIARYDLVDGFDSMGIDELARRAVVVVDGSGRVTYVWEAPDPGEEPDYDAVLDAVRSA